MQGVVWNRGSSCGTRGLRSGSGSLPGAHRAPDPVMASLLVPPVLRGGQLLLALASTAAPSLPRACSLSPGATQLQSPECSQSPVAAPCATLSIAQLQLPARFHSPVAAPGMFPQPSAAPGALPQRKRRSTHRRAGSPGLPLPERDSALSFAGLHPGVQALAAAGFKPHQRAGAPWLQAEGPSPWFLCRFTDLAEAFKKPVCVGSRENRGKSAREETGSFFPAKKRRPFCEIGVHSKSLCRPSVTGGTRTVRTG